MTALSTYLAETILVMIWYQTETAKGCSIVIEALLDAEDDFRDAYNLEAVEVIQFCKEIATIKCELLEEFEVV